MARRKSIAQMEAQIDRIYRQFRGSDTDNIRAARVMDAYSNYRRNIANSPAGARNIREYQSARDNGLYSALPRIEREGREREYPRNVYMGLNQG